MKKVYNTFTVYTYEKPGDINQLLNKNIPIKLNGAEITALVQEISPFLMGYRVHLSLGSYPIKEYVYFLKEFYDEFQKYEIEIVDGINFTASKYFDIRNNSWKLINLFLQYYKLISFAGNFHRRIMINDFLIGAY